MTSYNKYYDTYIKQKTNGAISVNGKNYSFRNDGNSFFNGDIDISGNLNNVNLDNLYKITYIDISGNLSTTFDNINTSINNINFILTGCEYDEVNDYLNMTNSLHIYKKLYLGTIGDVENTIIENTTSINNNTTSINNNTTSINNNTTSINNINNNITDIV